MLLRALRGELLKGRRNPVWLVFLVLPLFPAGDVPVGDIGDAVVAVMHHGLAGFAQRQRNALGNLNQSVYHVHGGVPFSLKNSYKYYTISG